MRPLILSAAVLAILAIGCKDDSAKPVAPPAVPAASSAKQSATPSPTAIPNTRSPNNDKKDIQGVWQTTADAKDEPLQMEFSADDVTIRTGPGPNWKQSTKVPYTLRNEIAPSQIDWGTGAEGGYGLYTLDGKNLIINYATGGPENRPKRLEKSKDAKQVWLERAG